MRKTLPIAAGLIAGSLLSGAAGAATTEELERRIQELEQTVRLLNRKQEVSEEIYVADKSRAATAGTVKAGLDGFALVSPDKQAELKLRGLRFGSVEITVHYGRIVQIERREKLRLDSPAAQVSAKPTHKSNPKSD